jgi:hypothetical protein
MMTCDFMGGCFVKLDSAVRRVKKRVVLKIQFFIREIDGCCGKIFAVKSLG